MKFLRHSGRSISIISASLAFFLCGLANTAATADVSFASTSSAQTMTFETMVKCDAAFVVFSLFRRTPSLVHDTANLGKLKAVTYNPNIENGNGGGQKRGSALERLYAAEKHISQSEGADMAQYLRSKEQNRAFERYAGDASALVEDYQTCLTLGADR